MHESLFHSFSSFVTLTYDDAHVPYGHDLHYRHFRLFHKRLHRRTEYHLGKEAASKLKFFMCGEYGERLGRPHYHAILFGKFFHDRKPWRTSSAGFQLYRSEELDSLWDLGGAEIGDLSLESAAYCARYCMGKITGPMADSHYEKLVLDTGEIIQQTPEFMNCSRGIGAKFYSKYLSDMYPEDRVIMDGRAHKVPRYYDKRLEVDHPDTFEALRSRRLERAMACKDDCSHDRLRVRDVVMRARLSFKQRTLE